MTMPSGCVELTAEELEYCGGLSKTAWALIGICAILFIAGCCLCITGSMSLGAIEP